MAAESDDLVTVRRGDLCESREQFIAHQCNCVSKSGRGVAKSVFQRFPEANIYSRRAAEDTPGHIVVRGRVVNMLAQRYPGKAKYANDTAALRLEWFDACLDEIAQLPDIGSVAFPFRIGCGLAGGDWAEYESRLVAFASRHNIRVVLYKFEG
eukprot:Amastigsp_a341000_14.p1 type:complete len:153 gc:universal Amastigsp_a341000_14:505-47(-)